MREKYPNSENEVYFLGSTQNRDKKRSNKIWYIIGGSIIIVVLSVTLFLLLHKSSANYYFEPEIGNNESEQTDSINYLPTNDTIKGYIEILEETVNDVPMYVYVPHNAKLSLLIGTPNKKDSSIIFITQAADIRGDNLQIVGDFVLAGERLSKGVAKTGFCAIIDSTITIGVSDDTPFLQKAIDSQGYFFRQYPLVNNGELIENNPKNKSIRRALAIRSGKTIMIESRSNESFHDFAQALIDIGVSDAIYLVGTNNAYGWYYGEDHQRTEFGKDQTEKLKNTTFIVWRSNQ